MLWGGCIWSKIQWCCFRFNGCNCKDATTQSKLDDIKSKVDTLENTDLTEVTEDLTIINNGVKKASLLIPHTDNI